MTQCFVFSCPFYIKQQKVPPSLPHAAPHVRVRNVLFSLYDSIERGTPVSLCFPPSP